MLKDYPGHIERLQEVLNSVIEKPSKVTPPFEVAIWLLEGRLETFISEARAELKAAEASGDPVAIERAKAKELLMGRARSGNGGMRLGLMDDLWNYFETNKGAFE
ncbi:hypothetical protein EBB59_06580 [Lysobacter pythonis]|uniref:Uncharacterized protein n=2 Tax=Solilutibacter pythonis TaxID=2483112 RepID=A0A3M2HZD5_9GAMM|nr:hypothetical protein EBB59_06580 [Lysobacter pythonis]